MPVAVNDKGEVLRLDGGQWVPAQRATNPETGDSGALDGDKRVPIQAGRAPEAPPGARPAPMVDSGSRLRGRPTPKPGRASRSMETSGFPSRRAWHQRPPAVRAPPI